MTVKFDRAIRPVCSVLWDSNTAMALDTTSTQYRFKITDVTFAANQRDKQSQYVSFAQKKILVDS